MRILIASTYVPFVSGGGTMILDSLVAELRRRGHTAEAIRLPFRSYWPEIQSQTAAVRSIDLTETSSGKTDLLITIRYPSFAIKHPNKVTWFIHHHRSAYDLWQTPFGDIPASPESLAFREALSRSDTRFLRESRRIYALSSVVAERLSKFNGIQADGVLHHPHPRPEMFSPGEPGDYFLYVSRLVPVKRQSLAIQAIRYTRSPFRLVVAGAADVKAYDDELRQLALDLGVSDRVQFTGWVSDEEKARLTAGAFAALSLPYDEDSYGYTTLEAVLSAKPVIALQDSGGVLDLVEHGITGLVCAPSPQALAEAMELLWADRDRARRMGLASLEGLRKKPISWDRVIDGLLG